MNVIPVSGSISAVLALSGPAGLVMAAVVAGLLGFTAIVLGVVAYRTGRPSRRGRPLSIVVRQAA